MQQEPTFTPISNLGEFGLIDHLTKNFEQYNSSTIVGIGDDAAVVNSLGQDNLISTDMMLEGVHFDLNYFPLKYLGFKIVTINVSDIYAMNAEPTQFLLSLACSNIFTVEALTELYEGVHEACEFYKIDLVGGDTTSSRQGLILSGTAVGECPDGQFVTRKNAGDHDLICVTGDLGAAYMGLLILEREKEVSKNNPHMIPDWDDKDYLLQKFLKPIARKELPIFFKAENLNPTSMIDVSDGLSSELKHICKQSNKGCVIYENKLPINDQTREMAMKFNISSTIAALSGGEDYEILFTISQADYAKVENVNGITVIGHMVPEPDKQILITSSGREIPLEAQGWNHF